MKPAIVIFFLMLSLTECKKEEVFEIPEGCIDKSKINPNAFCPQDVPIVCGCDGVSYINSCQALAVAGVTSTVPGPCKK